MATTLDRPAYHTLAKAARRSGIPRPLMGTLVAQGLVPSIQIPGHLPVVRLDDVEKALRLLEVPANPRPQTMS